VNVTVLYFAAVRELVGKDEEAIALPEGVASIAAVGEHLSRLHPALEGRLSYVRFARNEEFVQAADPVAEGDVIALIPPVAGG